jgi:mRNA interferase RelE/StbE
MNVKFSNKADKQFDRLSEAARSQLSTAILKLEKDPPEGDIKKLAGRLADYRMRSGVYRIFFEIKDNNIVIKQILTRGQAYKHRRK